MAIIPRRGGDLPARRELTRDPFQRMQDIMSMDPLEMLRQWTGGGLGPREGMEFIPSFEVKETKDNFQFKADLPGVKEDDVEISVTGDRLSISGKREEERRDEGDRYFAYERSYGSFNRSFTLPDGVDVDNLQAELKDGVLRLVLPKKPEVQPRRIRLGRGSEQKH